MRLEGSLSLRGNQPIGDYCPMERALGVVSTRSAILVMREAFYGATRFEEFAARTGLTEATTSVQLKALAGAGLLDKRPYQEAGQRRRLEYVLTDAGEDLVPVLLAMLQWGNRHDPPPYPPDVHHTGCGAPISVVARCAAGHDVQPDDMTVTAEGPFGVASAPRLSPPAG